LIDLCDIVDQIYFLGRVVLLLEGRCESKFVGLNTTKIEIHEDDDASEGNNGKEN
jgi:hypothetical protein